MMMTLLESLAEQETIARSVLGSCASTGLVGSVLSLKEGFSRFVKFELSNFAVGWVDWDLHLRAVLLGDDDFLDVDAPSSSVDGEDLS